MLKQSYDRLSKSQPFRSIIAQTALRLLKCYLVGQSTTAIADIFTVKEVKLKSMQLLKWLLADKPIIGYCSG